MSLLAARDFDWICVKGADRAAQTVDDSFLGFVSNVLRDVLIFCGMNIVCKLFCKSQSDFYSTRSLVLIEALIEKRARAGGIRPHWFRSVLRRICRDYSSFQFISKLPSTMKNAASPRAMIVLVRAWAGCA